MPRPKLVPSNDKEKENVPRFMQIQQPKVRPTPKGSARKPKVQPTRKGLAPQDFRCVVIGNREQGKVYLTRAEGEEGQPYQYLKWTGKRINYKGCECGFDVRIREDFLRDQKSLSRVLLEHRNGLEHDAGMKSQAVAFAGSLSRPEEKTAPERRRALMSLPRAAASVQAPYSQLATPSSTFGGSALPTTDAGLSFIGGGVAGETPAALQQALPTTRSNYTFQLPDSNLTDAARHADLDKIPGGVLLAQVASGASAVVYAFKWRDPNDRGYVIDAQIDSASDLRKGPLLLLRKEASMQVAKESYQNEAEPLRIAKVFNDNEDGVGEFADEEAAYDAILARRVEPEFIMGCSGSGMTHQGEVHLALTPTRT